MAKSHPDLRLNTINIYLWLQRPGYGGDSKMPIMTMSVASGSQVKSHFAVYIACYFMFKGDRKMKLNDPGKQSESQIRAEHRS